MIEIEKHHKRFRALALVVKAKAKDSTRYAIEYLYADIDNIVATDGHRLHCMANVNALDGQETDKLLEPGLYHVRKATKSLLWLELETFQDLETPPRFPKYQDVIPNPENYCDGGIIATYPQLVYLMGRINVCVHPDYIRDIVPKDSADKYRISWDDENRPVRIETKDGVTCVVMPIKAPEFFVSVREPEQQAVAG